MDSAGFNKLGLDARDVASVDVFNERAWETVLHTKQDADLLHP